MGCSLRFSTMRSHPAYSFSVQLTCAASCTASTALLFIAAASPAAVGCAWGSAAHMGGGWHSMAEHDSGIYGLLQGHTKLLQPAPSNYSPSPVKANTHWRSLL